jgi:methionine aminopeptidase
VVAANPAAPVTGRAADVMQATATAFDAAARLMRPGKKASEVAAPLNKIAEAYGCR